MLFKGQDLEITLKLQIFVQVCLTLFFTGFTGPEAGVPVDKSSEFEGLASVRMQGLAWEVLDQLEQEQDVLERAVDELSEEELADHDDSQPGRRSHSRSGQLRWSFSDYPSAGANPAERFSEGGQGSVDPNLV